MIIRYNWIELNKISKLPEAHVIMLFGLYLGIKKPLSSNLSFLMKKLNVERIPNTLLTNNFILHYETGIYCNYTTNEPQCYVRNCSFLHMRVPALVKSNYLYILSQRSIYNKNNWIPEYYIEPEHYNNPFIYRSKGKITFPLETNYGKRLDTTEKTTSTRKL